MAEAAVGKMTRQRRIVLDAVRAASTHPDACEVYETARRVLPSISLGTVYRTLQMLARAGLIARIETAGSKMRFDANTAAHDHVTCAKCGRVMDTDAADIEAAKEFVSKATGFEIIGQRVEFTGVCPRCRKRVKGRARRVPAGKGAFLVGADIRALREALDELYRRYNRREFVHPDPLEFLYAYGDIRDREIAGLVASSLAYGRVAQILKSVAAVLDRMQSPAAFVARSTESAIKETFAGFKHRFTTGADLAAMLIGAKRALERFGSLEAAFVRSMKPGDRTTLPALEAFAAELNLPCGCQTTYLVPTPAAGSACKRLNLYLRWMVRRDDVDPGGWEGIAASRLVVPLDTHMFRICRSLGMTARNQADLKSALEITEAFRAIVPEDPVRYDFALTRLGIRSDADAEPFLRQCGVCEVA